LKRDPNAQKNKRMEGGNEGRRKLLIETFLLRIVQADIFFFPTFKVSIVALSLSLMASAEGMGLWIGDA